MAVVARGTLITIEGLDGAGKSTLAVALQRELAAGGRARRAAARAGRRRGVRADPCTGQGSDAGGAAAYRGAAVRRRARAARRGAPATPAGRAAWWCCWTASSTPRSPTRASGASLGVEQVRGDQPVRHRRARRPTARCCCGSRPADGRARQRAGAEARPSGARGRRTSSRRSRRLRADRRREPGRIRVIDASQAPAGVLQTRSRRSLTSWAHRRRARFPGRGTGALRWASSWSTPMPSI